MRKVLLTLIGSALLCAAPAAAEVDYRPTDRATTSISVSATSQALQLSSTNGTQRVRIFNAGSATAWIRFGCAGVTAAVGSDIPEPAGAVETITITTSTCAPNVAAVAAGATGSIYFTLGSVVR